MKLEENKLICSWVFLALDCKNWRKVMWLTMKSVCRWWCVFLTDLLTALLSCLFGHYCNDALSYAYQCLSGPSSNLNYLGHYKDLTDWPHMGSEACRISPPQFSAECRKRRLNQASFVLLYFVFFVFWVEFSMYIFLCCFVCQYQSSDWLWRPSTKWPRFCRVGC